MEDVTVTSLRTPIALFRWWARCFGCTRMLRIRLALAIGLVAYASTITMAATLRVVDYGARCDGSTNDWAAIQAAINAANAGDLIEFPAGWCAFSGNIFISSRSNLELYGAGMPNT